MDWEAIGAIGEIIGAAAVVVTLVYLAAQMKTNTAAVNRSASQAAVLGRAESAKFIAGDSEVSSIFWQGAKDPDSLSQEDWQRFFFIVSAALRPVEMAYLDFKEGLMSEDVWSGQKASLEHWFVTPGFQRWLDEYGHSFNKDFREYVEEIVRNTSTKNRQQISETET